jgi:hypothetical protein
MASAGPEGGNQTLSWMDRSMEWWILGKGIDGEAGSRREPRENHGVENHERTRADEYGRDDESNQLYLAAFFL